MLATSSCKKENNTPTTPANTPPQVTTPGDAYGIIGVVRATGVYEVPSMPGMPTIDPIVYNIGTAIAGFWTSPGATSYVAAGNVSVNDSVLAQSNNAYAFQPKGASSGGDMGLNTSASSYNWEVSGSSDVVGFTRTFSGSQATMPSIGSITSSKDVATTESYTVTLNSSIMGADSIIWVLGGPDAHITRTTGTGISSYTFTAEEVGSLGKGDNAGIVQVAPYKLTSFTENGKKYYWIREAVAHQFVNLK